MRRINIRVTTRAKQQKIVTEDNGDLHIYTNAVPTDGDANTSVIKMLAQYLDVPKSQIKIVRGETSRNKVIEY